MSRSVVYAPRLRPLTARARHPAREQVLAHGVSAGYPVPLGPGPEPGRVSYHRGPDFIARRPEARS